MFSSSLHRCSTAAFHRGCQQAVPGASVSPLTSSSSSTSLSSSLGKIEQSRLYHSDNSVYGFKENGIVEANEVKSIRFPKLQHLVNAYRNYGHLEAATNPLKTSGRRTNATDIFEARAREIADEDLQLQDVISGKQFDSVQVNCLLVVVVIVGYCGGYCNCCYYVLL